jgi:hypothetical protein
VYCDNHTKPINALFVKNVDLLIVKVGGSNRYHRVLKGECM